MMEKAVIVTAVGLAIAGALFFMAPSWLLL